MDVSLASDASTLQEGYVAPAGSGRKSTARPGVVAAKPDPRGPTRKDSAVRDHGPAYAQRKIRLGEMNG